MEYIKKYWLLMIGYGIIITLLVWLFILQSKWIDADNNIKDKCLLTELYLVGNSEERHTRVYDCSGVDLNDKG